MKISDESSSLPGRKGQADAAARLQFSEVMMRSTSAILAAVATAAVGAMVSTVHGEAKNVILLISDGAGYNTHAATEFYRGSKAVYEGAGWVNHPVSNYPLRFGTSPIAGAAGLAQDPNTVYASNRAWNTTPIGTTTGNYPDNFQGYQFSKTTYPDSANTIVSMMTGQKTYNNAVNVDGNGTSLYTFPEKVKQQYGKQVGIVSTVQWGDATPAVSAGAHNVSRANRNAITDEILSAGVVDVIMGGGNPDYDNNGVLRATPNNSWISNSTWTGLKNNTNPNWQLIQQKSDFEALANGILAPTPGKKIVGTFQAFDAHQSYRGPTGGPNTTTPGGFPSGAGQADNKLPYTDAAVANTPDFTTMIKGTIGLLDDNANGFFLMAEAGGVDRAMHANALGRMIEDQIEFDNAVSYIGQYLDANTNGNNWSNTLVVVTADHDHLLFGADSDTNPFSAIGDNGDGNLPGHKWQFSSHGNQLVPLYARGVGAEQFALFADQLDSYTDGTRTFGRGLYLDQTDIYTVLNSVVPEPATIGTLVIGGVAMALRRRRD